MKKLFLILIGTLLTASTAFGAASTTQSNYIETAGGVKITKIVFVAAANGAFTSATLNNLVGRKLHSVSVVSGATGATTDSDLSITDSVNNQNYVATNGANKVDGDNTYNFLVPDTAYSPCIPLGSLTVAIANNSVDSATVTVYITSDSSFE